MKQVCQSCGMPLSNKGRDLRGTEQDGSRSEIYCSYCYLNGEFVEPNITMDEMIVRGIQGINREPGSKIKKKILIKTYPMMIKRLARWQK